MVGIGPYILPDDREIGRSALANIFPIAVHTLPRTIGTISETILGTFLQIIVDVRNAWQLIVVFIVFSKLLVLFTSTYDHIKPFVKINKK